MSKIKYKVQHPASMLARFGAFVIDWMVCGLILGTINAIGYRILSGTDDLFTDYYSFLLADVPVSSIAIPFCICMIAGIIYYVLIPYSVWSGQTLGKKLFNIQIINESSKLSILNLFIRNFVLFILIGCASPVSTTLRQFITVNIKINVDEPWLVIGSVLCVISFGIAMWKSSGKTIHDRLTHTKVISVKN
ncbi:RDD family protein [Faecalitalea cylindroides]|uniref:RDD family protein n=1 Tax=Faecalitalea cylindroides TaxID=39483 RepID=UPI000B37B893|nr:RDD family protein [Faecalitalea cylindroides]OUN61093.1 hypothetical protein B5G15_06100 [Faecalitalea cylindroides]